MTGHATLALVDVQIDIARLLSSATRELNASNMFKLAEALNKAQTPFAAMLCKQGVRGSSPLASTG
jgi:hypothetical protein